MGIVNATENKRSSSTESQLNPAAQVLEGRSRDPNDFISAALAAHYRNRGSREVQKLREKFDASLISPTINRRCSEANLQSFSQFPNYGIPSPPWLHFNRKRDAGTGFVESDHVLYDIRSLKGPLAQRLEQRTHNPLVLGSNPRGPTIRVNVQSIPARSARISPDGDLPA
jgi:hypothetical protein